MQNLLHRDLQELHTAGPSLSRPTLLADSELQSIAQRSRTSVLLSMQHLGQQLESLAAKAGLTGFQLVQGSIGLAALAVIVALVSLLRQVSAFCWTLPCKVALAGQKRPLWQLLCTLVQVD